MNIDDKVWNQTHPRIHSQTWTRVWNRTQDRVGSTLQTWDLKSWFFTRNQVFEEINQ